jgi:hypothetical protein
MRVFLVLTTLLQLAISPALAQTPPQSAASRANALSLGQKTKISELITRRTPPLAASSFSIAVDSVVPANIEVHALPAEAERLAPQLRDFGYVVIEELIALVNPRTRNVEIVIPRWQAP